MESLFCFSAHLRAAEETENSIDQQKIEISRARSKQMVRCSHAGCWNGVPCAVHNPHSVVDLTSEQMLHPDGLSDAVIMKLLLEKNVSGSTQHSQQQHITHAAAASPVLLSRGHPVSLRLLIAQYSEDTPLLYIHITFNALMFMCLPPPPFILFHHSPLIDTCVYKGKQRRNCRSV